VIQPLVISSSLREVLQVSTAIILVVTIVIAYLLWSFVKGAGYEPVPRVILEEMIQFSQPGPDKRVYDLGSGFGKILFRVAQTTGATCVGVEVDPLKVWWTRREARAKGLQAKVTVLKGNLLEADISSADIVFVFLWDGIMQKLKERVLAQMKPGSAVVSYFHEFHGWTPEKQDRKAKVFLYRVGPSGQPAAP
jgi:ribosomal protein L11 methylase PrmA